MFLSRRLLKLANTVLVAACTAVSAAMNATSAADFHTVRLTQIRGDGGKANDVLFCGSRHPAERNVIFFTGDVQDYREKMVEHRDNHRYAKWDVESTAALLFCHFPHSNVWVVKAARMELGTFAIYSNFVTWKSVADGAGGPFHNSGQRSWHHLQQLMDNAVSQMNACSDGSADTCSAVPSAPLHSGIYSSSLPVILVGFSKGCVVLNQLSYDRAVTLNTEAAGEDDAHAREFAKLANEMYWLDGGHAGGRETWVTDDSVHKSLAGVTIHCHVTPYQVKDSSRPWIGKEYRRFSTGLTKHNVTFTNKIHFVDEQRSLENHFRVLESF